MTTHSNDLFLRPMLPKDDTKKFSMGNSAHTPLKTFLQKDALNFHQNEIAKTFVLAEHPSTPSRVRGYISLMNSEITLNDNQKPQTRSQYETFPAIKIARLAIDKSIQGQKYGSKLLEWCIGHIKLAISPHVGCRFLVVDAKQNSIPFYEKSGFIFLDTKDNRKSEHPLMFFDLLH